MFVIKNIKKKTHYNKKKVSKKYKKSWLGYMFLDHKYF
jgi:hypothetical protein